MRHLRNLLPLLVSAGLIGWLLTRVPLTDRPAEDGRPPTLGLLSAFAELDWQLLLPATGLLVVALYFWESFCFCVVFAYRQQRPAYGEMLRVRGLSYLAGVINYEAGQALAAWQIAKRQDATVLWGLSRALLLGYHDLLLLFGLGLLGATLAVDPRGAELQGVVLIVFGVLASLSLVPVLLPTAYRERFRQSRWGAGLDTWSWTRSAQVIAVRLVYFGIIILYAAIALAICGIPVNHTTTLSTIPLVVAADALPSAAGLGPRDTALQLLLKPQRPEVLLAMSLIWSTGMLLGRSAIGLLNLWLRKPAGDTIEKVAGSLRVP